MIEEDVTYKLLTEKIDKVLENVRTWDEFEWNHDSSESDTSFPSSDSTQKPQLEEELTIVKNVLTSSETLSSINKIFDIAAAHTYGEKKINGYWTYLANLNECLNQVIGYHEDMQSFQQDKHSKKKGGQKLSKWADFYMCLSEWSKCATILCRLEEFRRSNHSLFPHEGLWKLPREGKCDPSAPDNDVQKSVEQFTQDKIDQYHEVIGMLDDIRQEAFYGHCNAYYFTPETHTAFELLDSLMVGFHHSYIKERGLMSACLNSIKFIVEPEVRAIQLVKITRIIGVDFHKKFYALAENSLITHLGNIPLPNMEVCKDFTITPEPLELNTKNGSKVEIKPYKQEKIHLRLLCAELLNGQQHLFNGEKHQPWDMTKDMKNVTLKKFVRFCKVKVKGVDEPSNRLLFHIHGGGFVGSSAKNHDMYLRPWASKLECPILSINYSHAPENPFPEAIEECFYTYCWLLQNKDKLGCTKDAKVVVCGDSAGGNMAFALGLMAIHHNLAEQPDGILCSYAPLLLSPIVTPSRFLVLSDPFIPLGILPRFLLAYSGKDELEVLKSYNYKDWHPDFSAVKESEADTDNSNPTSPASSGDGVMSVAAFYNQGVEASKELKPLIVPEKDSEEEKKRQSVVLKILREYEYPQSVFKSPLLVSDEMLKQMPPTVLVCSDSDPFLDDNVEMANRLQRLGNKHRLEIVPKLPHGFLCIAMVGHSVAEAMENCRQQIQSLFDGKI